MSTVHSSSVMQLLTLGDSRKANPEVCGNNKPVVRQSARTTLPLSFALVIASRLSIQRNKWQDENPLACGPYEASPPLIAWAAELGTRQTPTEDPTVEHVGTGLSVRENAEHRHAWCSGFLFLLERLTASRGDLSFSYLFLLFYGCFCAIRSPSRSNSTSHFMNTPDTDSPHLETLIVSRVLRGDGLGDHNPFRRVLQIHTAEGKMLAEEDQFKFHPLFAELDTNKARIKHLEACVDNYKQTVADLQLELKKADAAAKLRKFARK